MSDEDALLRAIVESPDDLALRLVYADFCEENGRAARAALIRGQCFLDAVLPAKPPPDEFGSRTDARYLRPRSLTPELRQSLLEPFRGFIESAGLGWGLFPGVFGEEGMEYTVRRGFIETHTLIGLSQLRHWLFDGPAILARAPIQRLGLQRWYGSGPDADRSSIPDDLLRMLLRVEGVGRLRELDLSDFQLDDDGAAALLDAPALPRRTLLRTRDDGLSQARADALIARFGDAIELQRGSDDDIPF